MPPPRRVIVLAVEGAQSLDVLGPIEAFHYASLQAPGAYEIELVGPGDRGFITAASGVTIGVRPLPSPPPRHDTLVIAGGQGARYATDDEEIAAWIRTASSRARRTASICTGAYLLAAAGLLDGRKATTHWNYCADLAEQFPKVELDPEPVFVRDGDIWTSAGVTAGMDLTLALIEDDLGPELALAVARMLVVFLKRPGGQAQFSGALAVQQATRPALRELQAWIASHLDDDLSVANLAERAGFSPRSFARAFRHEVGMTPAAYVEALRVERARTLLEDGAPTLEAVAQGAGFSSTEVLRRAFHRHLGVSPADYRGRFRLVPEAP